MRDNIFKNFAEYWFYAKVLSEKQREVILNSLTENQKNDLIRSYHDGGWEDLIVRNEIDHMLDRINKTSGIDLLFIRCQVMSGKKVYIKKDQWEYIINTFSSFKNEHTYYIIGGIKAEIASDDMYVLIKEK